MPRALDIDLEIANQGVPISAQGIYRRALAGNRPAAVKAMCLSCQGWEDGARQAIRDCPSVGCPLHAVRPFQKKAGSAGAVEIDSEEEEENPHRPVSAGLALGGANLANYGKDGEEVPGPLIDITIARSKILDHLHRKGESQRGYILFSTGIPESLWNDAIRSLLAEGLIEREGEKRNTHYRLKGAEGLPWQPK